VLWLPVAGPPVPPRRGLLCNGRGPPARSCCPASASPALVRAISAPVQGKTFAAQLNVPCTVRWAKMSYYDIDAILTDAEVDSPRNWPFSRRQNSQTDAPVQKLPCTFNLDVPGLGYIDNNPGHDLKRGTKVSLPVWLAELLAVTSSSVNNPSGDPSANSAFVTLETPSALNAEVISALKADPRAVPLRDRSPHFYGLAARALDLFDEPELSEVLRATFVGRAAEVSLHARKAGVGSSRGEDKGAGGKGGGGGGVMQVVMGAGEQEFLRGLDEWERRLFRAAHDGARAEREWRESVKKH
jgi:GINS complex subunit 3